MMGCKIARLKTWGAKSHNWQKIGVKVQLSLSFVIKFLISWIINMTNIFNISETHYYKQNAQKNITNLLDNDFFGTLL